MLTKRQKEVFDFIQAYTRKHGYAPLLEEIKKHLGLSSVSTAHHHVKQLQEAGFIHKKYNQARAVSSTAHVETIDVPILGTIAAGAPIEAIETHDQHITITEQEIGRMGKHYALRVQGNSMLDEGIFDGDMVIVREQPTAENGQTVVAIIDGNHATLKKLYREKNTFRLQPANPMLRPMYRDEVEVRGIVVKIIRNLYTPVEKEHVRDTKFKRTIDYSWDYRGEKTKSYTHGLHTYPAMFIPQVARRLIQTYSSKHDCIADIFCGSGTTLVESRLLGRNAVGIDLNPLAIMIAKAKTTPIAPTLLTKHYFALVKHIEKLRDDAVVKPQFSNIDFWFKKNVITKLAKIKTAIYAIQEETIRNFFLVSFSETVRLASNTKNGEFKLVRIPKEKLDVFDPDVMSMFKKKTEANIQKMQDFYAAVDTTTNVKIIRGNASHSNGITPNSVDCIITSPPYGDSRTTVAYGQFSRLSAQWMDVFDTPEAASRLDNELLGGKPTKDLQHTLCSTYLNGALEAIAKKDASRAKEVLSFYVELNRCLRQAYTMLKSQRFFCLVVGNRLVKQVRIPTDFIIAELGEAIGFTSEEILVRNIQGKRIPSKTSPTNVVGASEETMTKESIVILKSIKKDS